jgi:hypothetical protein
MDAMTPQMFACYFGARYARLTRMLAASATRHCPKWDLRLVEVPAIGALETKLTHWARAVDEAPDGTLLLLIDADLVILHPLDDLWDSPFDVAYTARDRRWSPWPNNAGVIAVRVSDGVRAFMWAWERRTLELVRTSGPTRKAWLARFGAVDQAALDEQLKTTALTVHTLSCLEWNCEDSSWAHFNTTRTRILHIKGALREALFGDQVRPRRAEAVTPLLARWRALEAELSAVAAPAVAAPVVESVLPPVRTVPVPARHQREYTFAVRRPAGAASRRAPAVPQPAARRPRAGTFVPTWTQGEPQASDPSTLPRVAISIRTANRTPNYLGATVRQLVAQGMDPALIHVCATAPEVGWLDRELAGMAVTRHVPDRRLSPNQNGLALIRVLDPLQYDWVLLLEDDLEFCADFLGSVQRWLQRVARPSRHVYRLCGFRMQPPHRGVMAYDWTLYGMGGSQAVLLRMADALDFVAWADVNMAEWARPRANKEVAFDKLISAWALHRWPDTPGMVSHPNFVNHIGATSSLHRGTLFNADKFAGTRWSFHPPALPQEATA